MKILLAGDTYPENPWSKDRLPAQKEALEGYDHEIIDLFSFNSDEEAWKIRCGDIKGWFAEQNLYKLNSKFIQNIESICAVPSYYSDCPIAMGHNVLVLGSLDTVSLFLFPETIRELQEKGIKIVCYFGDDEYLLNRHSHWVDRFDKCVAHVRWCADYYNNIVPGSTYYLPWGSYFGDLKRDFSPRKDFVFVGSPFDDPTGERPVCLRALIESGFNVDIYGGKGWETMHKGFFKSNYKGYLPVSEVTETIGQYKISLAFLEDHIDGSLHTNANIWATAPASTMCLSTYYEPLFKDYCFTEGENIVTFKDSNELVNKAYTYINGIYDEVGNNLYKFVKENYNLVNLYKTFFKSLWKL